MSGERRLDVRRVAMEFAKEGKLLGVEPYGNGHINDTFLARYRDASGERRLICQRINHEVFRNPAAVMENIVRVTAHQHRRLAEEGCADAERRALRTVATSGGAPFYLDAEGNTWRSYLFIEGASSLEAVETPGQAREAARAFGRFQGQLADLPGERLHETIPGFHHTPSRLRALQDAVERDPFNRACGVAAEVEFVLGREAQVRRLVEAQEAGLLPERITHNDTKLNNVLIDARTQEGICVIDLDTVMPGLALYDFGDLVRSSTSPTAEDERDLSKVGMRMPMFAALVDGYLGAASGFLLAAEKAELAFCGRLITLEIGMRFLTDHLEGDRYFRIHRADQNLDRSRAQFRLVRSMEEQEEAMERMVEEWTPSSSAALAESCA